VRTDGADRVGDPWERLLAPRDPGADPDVDEELEAALLSYKQRRAAAWGAERFAAELRRREEAEGHRQVWTNEALAAPVEASVENQVVEGEPATFRPEPPRIGFDPMLVVAPLMPAPAEETHVAAEEPPAEVEQLDPVEATVPVGEPEPVVEAQPAEEAEEPETAVAPVVRFTPPAFLPDAPWSAGSPASGMRDRLPAALRNPHVPRPPAPDQDPGVQPKRRWHGKRGQPEPTRATTISAPEWARMSPGARRLYGVDDQSDRRAG